MSVFFQIISLLVGVNTFAHVSTLQCQLPVGIQDFEYLRENNFCFVDKTGFISKILESKQKFYFIARPRKFGKSLFCRTIESVLWGNKEFFQDLAINNDYKWEVYYPVIYLDFSTFGLESRNADEYAKAIVNELQRISYDIIKNKQKKIKDHNVVIHPGNGNSISVQDSLKDLVRSLKEAFLSTVSIVIDEYDSAITKNLKNSELLTAISSVLRDFYSCIKGLSIDLRLVFITGVAKFAQSYLFSSMNILNDISRDEEYSDALGFTEEEIKHFNFAIEAVVKYKKEKLGKTATTDGEIKEMKKNYDGYKFTANGPFLFHPAFLILYLEKKDHDIVAEMIPEPKHLFDLLPTTLHSSRMLTGINVTAQDLKGVTDPRHIELAPLLYYTGIFSIKEYDDYSNTYFLHYPNDYIAAYFQDKVFKTLTYPLDLQVDFPSFRDQCIKMVNDLLIGDEDHVRKYFDQLDILAIRRPYATHPRKPSDDDIKNPSKQDFYFKLEGAFQYMIEICLDVTKTGHVRLERQLSHGRGDIEFQIPKRSKTILYETRVGVGDAREALNQLLRLYAKAYLNNNRILVCIAVSFSKETRQLEDWIYAEYDEKGKLLKFFSHKQYDVNEMNLYDRCDCTKVGMNYSQSNMFQLI